MSILSILSLLPFPPRSAFAFDSEAWLGKREVFAREAERLARCYTNCACRVESPAADLTVPIETFADGSIKTAAFAKKAQYFLDKGLVWAEGVVIRRLLPGGKEDSRIEAERCVFDRAAKSGWASGAAKVVHGGNVFKGRDVYFSTADSYVRILAGADMTCTNVRDSVARIISRTGDFDREAGVALFEGAVGVRYARDYALGADRIYAFLSGTNDISRIVALGNTSVTNGSRTGRCEMAVYRRRRQEIEMFGGGEGKPAVLTDCERGTNTVAGTRIRFWIGSEQVEIRETQMTVGGERGRLAL